MACRFEVTLSGEDSHHVGGAHEALGEAGRLEQAWSVFRDDSTISAVNRRAADGPVAVDPELFDLLQRCRDLHADTEAAFDVTSTPLSRCWGFMARQGRVPSSEEIASARASVGMDGVALDADSRSVCFTRGGTSLNLGSIGKGYAVGAIASRLRHHGVRHALVSAASSSIVAIGGRGRGWTIDVCSRLARDHRLVRFFLRDAAMATSGAGEQFVEAGGRRYGHVIDPRTGWPAMGLLSVSVVTSDGAAADALATAFFVGGVALARRYCATHPETLVLVTPDDGTGRTLALGRHRGARLQGAVTWIDAGPVAIESEVL
jgi:thiamine biosynthesis lipoprotein